MFMRIVVKDEATKQLGQFDAIILDLEKRGRVVTEPELYTMIEFPLCGGAHTFPPGI